MDGDGDGGKAEQQTQMKSDCAKSQIKKRLSPSGPFSLPPYVRAWGGGEGWGWGDVYVDMMEGQKCQREGV